MATTTTTTTMEYSEWVCLGAGHLWGSSCTLIAKGGPQTFGCGGYLINVHRSPFIVHRSLLIVHHSRSAVSFIRLMFAILLGYLRICYGTVAQATTD